MDCEMMVTEVYTVQQAVHCSPSLHHPRTKYSLQQQQQRSVYATIRFTDTAANSEHAQRHFTQVVF
jgi:hypothetical protein